jgi:uncharacterized protein (DUF1697 family)
VKFIALLRGVNVSGANMMAMADFRAACARTGWEDVATYIQSGNLVFSAEGSAAAHEAALETLIEKEFGLSVAVIVRSAGQWRDYVEGNPFAKAAAEEPNRLMLCLSKAKPDPGAAAALQERAMDGEQVRLAGDALWIHFPGGSGTSKLSPALMNRLVGSPVTTRNWRTVSKLREMAA